VTQKLPPKLPPFKLFLDDYKCTASHCKPRENRDPTISKGPRVRTPWVYENGIFYKDYSNEHLPDKSAQCFEKDWDMIKFQKLKKSSNFECKEIMRKHYGLLRDCYRNEAGIGTVGKVFGVPGGQFVTFLQDIGVIGDDFNIADADRYYITVNAGSKDLKGPMLPKTALVRFQFLEIFIRTAIQKYYVSDAV